MFMTKSMYIYVFLYSLDLFSQLEKETGQAINLHTSGSVRIATSATRAEEMRCVAIV